MSLDQHASDERVQLTLSLVGPSEGRHGVVCGGVQWSEIEISRQQICGGGQRGAVWAVVTFVAQRSVVVLTGMEGRSRA